MDPSGGWQPFQSVRRSRPSCEEGRPLEKIKVFPGRMPPYVVWSFDARQLTGGPLFGDEIVQKRIALDEVLFRAIQGVARADNQHRNKDEREAKRCVSSHVNDRQLKP